MGAFTDLLKEENLSRIQIDSRLVPIFERVMKKVQVYFDANGYSNIKNYQEFFEKYLLLPKESEKVKYDRIGYIKNNAYHKGFTIEVNNEPDKNHWAGFYNKNDERICISEKYINYPSEEIESVLCHEFIHFIVMHSLDREHSNEDIYNGGFINEALTEMLTQQIYPNSNAYEPQTKMLMFANILTNNENNYKYFLKGGIDCYESSASWMNFSNYANNYQKEDSSKGYSLLMASKSKSYIDAQRQLIHFAISDIHRKSTEEYFDIIEKILKYLPVSDEEWINKTIEQLENGIVSRFYGINNSEIKSILLTKLKKIRQKFQELDLISSVKDNTKVISLLGYTFEIVKSGNIYHITINDKIKFDIKDSSNIYKTISISTPSGAKEISILAENNYLSIKLDNECWIKLDSKDFTVLENKDELLRKKKEEIDEIKGLFDIKKTNGLFNLFEYLKRENIEVLKIDEYKIPNFKGTYSLSSVYLIDVMKDGVLQKMFLSGNLQTPTYLNQIGSFKLEDFKGVTDNKNGALVIESSGEIKDARVYSVLSRNQINNHVLGRLSYVLKSSISEDVLNEYKSKIDITGLTDDEIRNEVANILAKERYEKLSLEEKAKLEQEVIEKYEQVALYEYNGEYSIGKKFTDSTILKVRKKNIYSKDNYSLLSEIANRILNNVNEEVSRQR